MHMLAIFLQGRLARHPISVGDWVRNILRPCYTLPIFGSLSKSDCCWIWTALLNAVLYLENLDFSKLKLNFLSLIHIMSSLYTNRLLVSVGFQSKFYKPGSYLFELDSKFQKSACFEQIVCLNDDLSYHQIQDQFCVVVFHFLAWSQFSKRRDLSNWVCIFQINRWFIVSCCFPVCFPSHSGTISYSIVCGLGSISLLSYFCYSQLFIWLLTILHLLLMSQSVMVLGFLRLSFLSLLLMVWFCHVIIVIECDVYSRE